MYALYKKEVRQFFSSLSGYLSIGLFLLLMGLFLFVFPDTSIFFYGYATLDKFFELAPYILLFLVPAVSMRSFSDEFKTGTWELLVTKPISRFQILLAKYAAVFSVVLLALSPVALYIFTIQSLSINGNIDTGAIAGAIIGLVLLAAIFAAIGICSSASTSNPVISFLLGAFGCFMVYNGFQSVSQLPFLQGGLDFWLASLGIQMHYYNVSKGLVAFQDILYFTIMVTFFLLATSKLLAKK